MTTYLVRNMDAFKAMLGKLEEGHCGKWAVIHSGELVGTYETEEDAANAADGCQGPSLIRQICPPLTATYVAMPVFNDDCWDENGNLDLDKWAQQPEPAVYHRPMLSYPKGYWVDDSG